MSVWELDINTQSSDIRLKYLEENGFNLSYLQDTTYVERLTAVTNYGSALQVIKEEDQTPYIVKMAIKNDPFALQYVKNKSGAICLLALKTIEDKLLGINPDIQERLFLSIFGMIKHWDFEDKDYKACLELSKKYKC